MTATASRTEAIEQHDAWLMSLRILGDLDYAARYAVRQVTRGEWRRRSHVERRRLREEKAYYRNMLRAEQLKQGIQRG